MALVRQVDINTDVGVYWLNQYNLFLNNIGYLGRDDAQLYFTEVASANRLTRTEASGRLNFSVIPARTFNSTLEITQGTQTVPSLFFTGDTNTGVYSPNANQFAITTNGIQALLIDSTQSITLSGDLTVNGGDINTSAPTFNLLLGATTVNVGATTSTTRLGSTVVGTGTTQSLFNTVATTVNAFNAATTLNLGNATTTQTANLMSGALSTGTKTVNLATGGTGTSVTSVSVGANTQGSTVNIVSPEFRINNIAAFECTSANVTGTAATTIASFPSQQFKSALFSIDVYNGQNFYSTRLHVVHNGDSTTTLCSDVHQNEYSVLVAGTNPVNVINAQLASVGGDINIVLQQAIAGTSKVRVVGQYVMF